MLIIDLAFRLTGKSLPADHGYLLYGALCRTIPQLHRTETSGSSSDTPLAIHPIHGRAMGDRQLAILPSSRLTLRIDADHIKEFLPLAGKPLVLGGSQTNVGVPEVRPLIPAARLQSRLVTMKGFMEPALFLDALKRQMVALGVQGEPGLQRRQMERSLEGRSGAEPDRCPFVRRTLRVRDKEIIGFAVEVRSLSAADSIKLQELGLGGRRHFGCGVFVPAGR